MNQMFRDREDDDDMRKKMGYFKMDQNTRNQMDSKISKMQGMRQAQREPGTGKVGSACTPATRHGGKGGMQGGPGGMMGGPGGMQGGQGGMQGPPG